ncbi:Uncharacterized membrane protein YeiB [Nannocystis exedens]|uniref:Uncharacterized membrane protein YeiB n=1 Tax=Nannocystis exedens TaxID=54 RepID=A0A1I1SLA6_9BACT|nr:DUF418 domain-containing protein [Nannocystis exedens]PCC75474.1 hypothetical protein NAEX_08585 [Nannocystis exedens]SFD45468.1 Uncharacterized membrane protein YeiB [Nannocystis exedens]
MLLVIALAHAQVLAAAPTDPGDHLVTGFHALFVDSRGYPMFAALFGYGVAQLLARHRRAGADEPEARARLRRRGRWLVGFGFMHALLLFHGDILGAYGLLVLLLLAATRSRERLLLAGAGGCLVLGALAFGVAARFIPDGADAELVTGPLLSAAYRVIGWIATTPLFAVMAAGPFLLGLWAARHGVLERPGRHLPWLRRTATIGIGVAALGGWPLVAVQAGWWGDAAAPQIAATALHTLTGYAGGFGYAALVAIVAARIGERRGPLVTALVACGQRSLSCYLAQSLAWQLLFEPYWAGLGGRLRPSVAAAVGFGVWALTVALAELSRRRGRQGPAEALLRRLLRDPERKE